MGRFLKWAISIIALLIVLCTVAVGGLFVLFKGTVQPVSGDLEIAGLSGPVEIIRDEHSIPHITATNRDDAYTALGFVHAQDRLWQMELLRRTGQGRLSEIFGKKTLDVDIFLRTLGFDQQVVSSFDVLNTETKSALVAYSKGINAYLAQKSETITPRLPPEFLIFGHRPEPWKPQDSMLVLKLMSLQLSMNMAHEFRRLALAAEGLSSAEIDDVIPYHKADNPPPMPDLREMFDFSSKSGVEKTVEYNGPMDDLWLEKTGRWASNNWVLSGARTKSGKPLVANDPHLAFNAPSLWYLAHLSWKEANGPIDLIGGTIPAMPGVLLGHNNHIAWGMTNSGGDAQDIFIEQVRGTPPSEILIPEGWTPLQVENITIRVKGAPDYELRRMTGRHGPLLPRKYKKVDEILTANHWAALSWTGLSKEDPGIQSVISIANSRTVAEFENVVAGNIAPMQTMVVADKAGNIGMFSPGKLPKRKAKNLMQGRAPVPGWFDEYDWEGIVPSEKMPAITNPTNGVLFSANTRPDGVNPDTHLTYDWVEPHRHQRIAKLIAGKNAKQTFADMVAVQNDSYSSGLIELRDLLLPLVDESGKRARYIAMLKEWDGKTQAGRPEPLLMTAFHRQVLIHIFEDDLGTTIEAAYKNSASNLTRILRQGGARNWCDNIKTTAKNESCIGTITTAFDVAIVELSKKYGDNPTKWKWGEAHYFYGEHQPFGKVWPLSKVFDIRRPASGDNFAIQRARSDFGNKEAPYRAVHGAGLRAVYDVGDLDKSVMISTSGQSGNAFSPYYDDLVDLWKDEKYVSLSTKRSDYSKKKIGTWRLIPKK